MHGGIPLSASLLLLDTLASTNITTAGGVAMTAIPREGPAILPPLLLGSCLSYGFYCCEETP